MRLFWLLRTGDVSSWLYDHCPSLNYHFIWAISPNGWLRWAITHPC